MSVCLCVFEILSQVLAASPDQPDSHSGHRTFKNPSEFYYIQINFFLGLNSARDGMNIHHFHFLHCNSESFHCQVVICT